MPLYEYVIGLVNDSYFKVQVTDLKICLLCKLIKISI